MDFRDISIDRVKFNVPVRRGASLNSKATYGAGKIAFQLPTCYAKFLDAPKFPGAVDMILQQSQSDPGSAAFLARLRDRAEEDENLAEHVENKDFFNPLRKLTAFDETPVFDACGVVMESSAELIGGTHEVSLLVHLDGAWISERSWGLRVRVSQVKVHRQRITPPPVTISFSQKSTQPRQGFMFQAEDDGEIAAKRTKFAFLDD